MFGITNLWKVCLQISQIPPIFSVNEVVIFKSLQGESEFQIILDNQSDTVWVTEQQMTDIFGKARRTIGEHIKNIYSEGELYRVSTWREFRQVQMFI